MENIVQDIYKVYNNIMKVNLIDWFLVFNATFSNISATSWQPVLVVEEAGVPGESPTNGKQLVNCITGDCESSAPFFVIYKLIWKCTHVSVFLLHFQVYFCGVLNFLDVYKNINKYIYIHHWIFCFSIELCRMCII